MPHYLHLYNGEKMAKTRKDKLRGLASGTSARGGDARSDYWDGSRSSDPMGRGYPLAEEYQRTGGTSTRITVEGTDTKTSVTVGPGRGSTVNQSDSGMDASTWKGHLEDGTANPALDRGVEHFEFNGETYSLTDTARDGSPLVVRA